MFIGFYAEWRAGSRGRDDTAPPAKEPICRACVLRRPPRCTGRCLAARRFSCPRVCGPLRWEGRAIPARRRAILFCLLRSAIACRQICRNARSEEKRFRICMIGPLFSDLRVEGERQAAHSHLDFELAIRVPIGRNGFGFIVQTQDVCAGDRKVSQPAFDLRAVMRRRFKKVDI